MKKFIIPILILMLSCKKEREPYYQFNTKLVYTVDNISTQDSVFIAKRGFPLKKDSTFTRILSSDVEADLIAKSYTFKSNVKTSVWNDKTVYNQGDCVTHEGKQYICVQWNSNKNPKVTMYNFQTVNYWLEGTGVVTKTTTYQKK